MAETRSIDWETISTLYRSGVRSLRDIATEHGISEGAIRKRAKSEGWPRDLSEKIKAKAAELVRIEAVRNGTQVPNERTVVEQNARAQADITISHRTDIAQKRELVSKLFAEISASTDGTDTIELMVLALQQNDMDSLASQARKLSSLPSRVKSTTDLIGALKTLVGLEREAWGVVSGSSVGEEITEIVRRIVEP